MNRTILLFASVLFVGCATVKSASKTSGAFQGATVLDMRQKEIQTKSQEALKGKCPQPIGQAPDPGGLIELKAESDGKLAARPMIWKGSETLSSCLVTELNKVTISPLPGPAITTLIGFGTYKAGEQPNDIAVNGLIRDHEGRIKDPLTVTCGSLLPPEFPADVKIALYIFPGGKVGGLNIVESNAKDGAFESCVAKFLTESKFPDPHFDGPYNTQINYHFGKLETH
ncbi:MAG TPA: hypothetical protein VH877_10110 [Polyangia bacterium]|jgi:hypothetical protein|nr:hypothetical protein [Polyangia bacterium]